MVLLLLCRWSRIARCSVLLGDTVSARQALERVGDQEADGERSSILTLERFTRDAQSAFAGKDFRKVPIPEGKFLLKIKV
jgi:hypothetical protein